MALDDPRRLIPRTDQLLALPPVRRALERLSEDVVRALVRETQDRARRGEIAPGEVEPAVLAYMLVTKIIDLLVNGYEGYPAWYLGVAGWGTVVLMIVGAIVLPQLRWRHDPDRFDAWPTADQLQLKGGAR